MKKLVICMIVAVLSGCATVQGPSPAATKSPSATYDRWDAVQQSARAAASAAASAGEDPSATYFNVMTTTANAVLHDGNPQDWAWRGKGPRPFDAIFQGDRYQCFQVAKNMVAGTGADRTIANIASGFVGAMNGEGWWWQ